MWADNEEVSAVVIDNGSGMLKAGTAGEDAPTVILTNAVGRPKHMSPELDESRRDTFIGDEAQRNRAMLNLSYPMDRGIVTNWDDMEAILRHVYDDGLSLRPEEQPLLMTESVMNPIANKEKMAQLMFETFQVPAYFTAIQEILAMYGSGYSPSGVICHSGHGITSVFPIYEGFNIKQSIQRMEIAGCDITNNLAQCLQDQGFSFTTSSELETVRDMKEQLCYTALDYEEEILKHEAKTYELVDAHGGTTSITLDRQRFQCTEAMFRPSLLGSGSEGIHKLVYRCLMECDIDTRSSLYCGIIPCGGNTLFPGFCDRLHKEMMALLPNNKRMNVVRRSERLYLPWIGGSLLASLSTFNSQWISKQDYEEYGPTIVTRKGCI